MKFDDPFVLFASESLWIHKSHNDILFFSVQFIILWDLLILFAWISILFIHYHINYWSLNHFPSYSSSFVSFSFLPKTRQKFPSLFIFNFFEWFHSFIFLLHSLLLPVWLLQWKPSTSRNSMRTPLSLFAVLPLLLAMISSGIRSSCSRTL